MTEATNAPQSITQSPLPGGGNKRRFIVVGTTIAILLFVFLGIIPRIMLHRKLLSESRESQNAIPNVYVTIAQPLPPGIAVQLSGTMSPITEAPLLARVDGYLVKRNVDIGDKVRAGQILAVIAAPELDQQVTQAASLVEQSRANLVQSQATLVQAKANAGLAQVTAHRWEELVRKGAVSRQANDSYQFAFSAQTAAVGVATASVAAATNSVGANAASLQHFRELQSFEVVRAPFDGVITERNVDTGALITATNTLLYRIAKNDTLRTFIDVPQVTASSIHVGDGADLKFVQFPSRTVHGTVVRTSNSLNANTRTLLTEVDVRNDDGSLLPGMYATVTFHLPQNLAAAYVPSEAIVFRANGTTVAVVDNENVIHFRPVTIGRDYGAILEVTSGIRAGEHVVANPDDTTVEGARVNPTVLARSGDSFNAAQTSSRNSGQQGKFQVENPK